MPGSGTGPSTYRRLPAASFVCLSTDPELPRTSFCSIRLTALAATLRSNLGRRLLDPGYWGITIGWPGVLVFVDRGGCDF